MTLRKALIVGATGLIGSSCLQYLFHDPVYSEVAALVRRTPLLENHRKLKEVITDFSNLEERIGILMSPLWNLLLVGSLKKYRPTYCGCFFDALNGYLSKEV